MKGCHSNFLFWSTYWNEQYNIFLRLLFFARRTVYKTNFIIWGEFVFIFRTSMHIIIPQSIHFQLYVIVTCFFCTYISCWRIFFYMNKHSNQLTQRVLVVGQSLWSCFVNIQSKLWYCFGCSWTLNITISNVNPLSKVSIVSRVGTLAFWPISRSY